MLAFCLLSLAALAALSQQLCLGRNKSRAPNNSWGKRQQLLHPSAVPTAGGWQEGRHPASQRRESFDFQSDHCVLSALHTPQTARPHLSQRRRGDGKGIKEPPPSLEGDKLGQMSTLPPPDSPGTCLPWRSHWPQLGCGFAAQSSKYLQIPSTRLLSGKN